MFLVFAGFFFRERILRARKKDTFFSTSIGDRARVTIRPQLRRLDAHT